MNSPRFAVLVFASLAASRIATAQSDPLITSWLTDYSGQYARVYLTDAERAANLSRVAWTNGGGTIIQAQPTYCGVHEIAYSANWVYLRSTGLGSHIMGPWYLNAGRTMIFPNTPKNMAVWYRLPRTPAFPGTKTLTGGGPIGYFVDGVSMFDSRDAFSHTSGSGSPGTEANPGSGYWNRDAYVNEGVTFDAALAHQPGSGQYHYHANPTALRHLLGDNVSFIPETKTYAEDTANTNLQHSPILGWVRDGIPVYGPYGYSMTNDANSPVRRMISGFRQRDSGAPGVSTRTTYPLWAVRVKGLATTNLTTEAGPAVSAQRPLGRYMEDNDYLGDLGFTLGVDFDLNEYNARWCVTPEFPAGTWAYFVCISSNGAPVYPYNIGRQFFGSPTGNNVTTLTEAVVTNFSGGPKMPLTMATPAHTPANSGLTLTWSAIDGGTYVLEATTDLAAWAPVATNAPGALTNLPASLTTRGQFFNGAVATADQRFYRARLVSTNAFDSAGFVP